MLIQSVDVHNSEDIIVIGTSTGLILTYGITVEKSCSGGGAAASMMHGQKPRAQTATMKKKNMFASFQMEDDVGGGQPKVVYDRDLDELAGTNVCDRQFYQIKSEPAVMGER